MSHYQVRFNQIYSSSVPIQVGTMRLLSGVTAEYQTEVGERYSRGLAVLTFPFNLCANIALLSLKAAHSSEAPVPSAADVNVTTVNDNAKGTWLDDVKAKTSNKSSFRPQFYSKQLFMDDPN